MQTRLWKDIRHLLPIALIGGAAGALLVHVTESIVQWFSVWGFYVTAILTGVLAFGHEHANDRMAMLLSQPIARGRVWAEKLAALAVVYVAMLVAILFAGTASEAVREETSVGPSFEILADGGTNFVEISNRVIQESAEKRYGRLGGRLITWSTVWLLRPRVLSHIDPVIPFAFGEPGSVRPNPIHYVWLDCVIRSLPHLAILASLICVGFWMGLAIRAPHTAFWAAAVVPFVFSFVWVPFSVFLHIPLGNENVSDPLSLAPPFIVLGIISLVVSRIHIHRMEV